MKFLNFNLDGHDIVETDAEILENLSVIRKSNYHYLKDLITKRINKEKSNGNKSFTEFGNFNQGNSIGVGERITNL